MFCLLLSELCQVQISWQQQQQQQQPLIIKTTLLLSGAGSDSAVRYSIYSGDPNGYFSINPVSGTIRTNTDLDHETHPFVLLNVAAMTGDPPTFGHSQV